MPNHAPHVTALYSMFIGGIGTLKQVIYKLFLNFDWFFITNHWIVVKGQRSNWKGEEMLGHSFKYVLTAILLENFDIFLPENLHSLPLLVDRRESEFWCYFFSPILYAGNVKALQSLHGNTYTYNTCTYFWHSTVQHYFKHELHNFYIVD